MDTNVILRPSYEYKYIWKQSKCEVTKGKHIHFKIQLREICKATNLPQFYDFHFHNLISGCCPPAGPPCRRINGSGPRQSDSGSRLASYHFKLLPRCSPTQQFGPQPARIFCSQSPTVSLFFLNRKKYRSFLITEKTL